MELAHIGGDVVPGAQGRAAAVPGQAAGRAAASHATPAANPTVPTEELQQPITATTSTNIIEFFLFLVNADSRFTTPMHAIQFVE